MSLGTLPINHPRVSELTPPNGLPESANSALGYSEGTAYELEVKGKG